MRTPWLVGYVVKNDKPYYYAMNFKSNDFGKDSQKDLQDLNKFKLVDLGWI